MKLGRRIIENIDTGSQGNKSGMTEKEISKLRLKEIEEEKLKEIKRGIQQIENDAKILDLSSKRIDILFKKKKQFLSKGYELADFKEPVLILLRRDMSAEYYEDIRPGNYQIDHSDKDVGKIYMQLPPSKLIKFPYGPKQFRGFVHNEDEYLPYPHDVLLNGEMVRIAIDKTLNDIKKWKAEETKAFGDMMWKILIGIAVILIAYAFYKMLGGGGTPAPVVPPIGPASNVSTIVTNMTDAIIR